MLFQQRGRELVTLLEKARRDLTDQQDLVGGTVSIGCVESSASMLLPKVFASFAEEHPKVQYDLYSANGDDTKEKLDRGEIDLGFLLEPVETALAEAGLGYPICVQGAYTIRETDGVRFVPIRPERTSGHVLAWKKNRALASATLRFIINDTILA